MISLRTITPAALLWAALATSADRLPAQGHPLSESDSALIGRILLAEDARDSGAVSLSEGVRHQDERVRVLALRARARIRDPRFVARDSLPVVRQSVAWPEPAWRSRYRALTLQSPCAALGAALADSVWHVRLRAADLAGAKCAADLATVATLRAWLESLPSGRSERTIGGVSWHAATHALEALATASPTAARTALPRFQRHPQWEVRRAAVRAATTLGDTSLLRTMTEDTHDNVVEAAIAGLSKHTGHASDPHYRRALRREGAQAVLAAATALRGTSDATVAAEALATWERWVARQDASAHDARVALLALAGRPASADRPPPVQVVLPPRAVELALGADIRLLVSMATESGGGSFVVRLRGDVAPMMAARILALAEAGYYDNTTWHRVEPDFVIQGGTRGENEYIGLPSFLRDELGTIAHPRGSVGMSTRGHDTGDAQWFINLKDNPRLVRDYTVFAEVIAGIETVDGVLEGDRIASIRVGATGDQLSPP